MFKTSTPQKWLYQPLECESRADWTHILSVPYLATIVLFILADNMLKSCWYRRLLRFSRKGAKHAKNKRENLSNFATLREIMFFSSCVISPHSCRLWRFLV